MKNPETSLRSGPIGPFVDKLNPVRTVFLSVFLAYLLLNGRHLFDPPYWDGVMGVYSQGVWLARHHLDYRSLLTQAPMEQGGTNVDLFYAWAPLFALGSNFLAPKAVFFLFHLLGIAGAAWTLSLFFAMARGRRPAWPWLLWILSAAIDPIWSGQTASMYIEIPLAALTAATLYAVWKGRYGWAAIACFASWFIKGTAILLAFSCAASVILLAAWPWLRGKKAVDVRLAFLLIPFPVMLVLKRWMVMAPYAGMWNFPDMIRKFAVHSISLYPMMAVEFVIAAAAVGCAVGVRRREREQLSEADRRLTASLLILVLVFWASFFIYPISLPRYLCMILFPQVLLIAFALHRQPRLSTTCAILVILVNAMNQYGRFLPRLSASEGRSGQELERSREYLLDLEANRRLCRTLEEQAFDQAIMVKWPFTQMLRLPELGYVTRPLPHVIDTGFNSSVAEAVELRTFLRMSPLPRTLCLYVPNSFDRYWGPSLKPEAGEVVVMEDDTLSAPVIVYERDWEALRRAAAHARR